MPGVKVKQQRVFRPKTPSMNATFLQHLSAMDLGVRLNVDELAMTSDPQAFYDAFYALAIGLLDTYYPERTITVTARDPHYVTADIKTKLRRKNRLMRAGRVDEAGALARQIGRAITRHNKRQLQRISTKHNSKELWKAIRQLTGRTRESAPDPAITADSLNQHYATVSTDVSYERPPPKDTVAERPGCGVGDTMSLTTRRLRC